MESCALGLTSMDFIFSLQRNIMRSDYVCSTVPASLQVQGHRAIGRGIAKRVKVDQKGG